MSILGAGVPWWQVLASPIAVVIAASITGGVALRALHVNAAQHRATLEHDRRMRWIDEARGPLINTLALLREGTQGLLTLRHVAVALKSDPSGPGLDEALDAMAELDERLRDCTSAMLVRFGPDSEICGALLLASHFFSDACNAVSPDFGQLRHEDPLTQVAEASHRYWPQSERFERAARALISAEPMDGG